MKYLADLLPAFRQCDNYADRLAFWEEYQLNEHLFYLIYEDDSNRQFSFSTWEELKQLPILTLTNFTYEEAKQFETWALRVRPGMKKQSGSFEANKRFVQEQYSKIQSVSDKKFFLDSYIQQIESIKKANFSIYGGNSSAEYLLKIDVSVYMEMIILLRIGSDFPLAHRIWQQENLEEYRQMDWRLIDTYLYAQSILQTSRFLETFDPAQLPAANAPQHTRPGTNKHTIFILPAARPALIGELIPYVDPSQHQTLKDLINDNREPSQPIICNCEQVRLERIFYEMVKVKDKKDRKIQSDKTKLSRWICQHFKRIELDTPKQLSYETILNYLKGKGFPNDQ